MNLMTEYHVVKTGPGDKLNIQLQFCGRQYTFETTTDEKHQIIKDGICLELIPNEFYCMVLVYELSHEYTYKYLVQQPRTTRKQKIIALFKKFLYFWKAIIHYGGPKKE